MINIIQTSVYMGSVNVREGSGGVQPYTWNNGRLNPNIQSMFGRLGEGGDISFE